MEVEIRATPMKPEEAENSPWSLQRDRDSANTLMLNFSGHQNCERINQQ